MLATNWYKKFLYFNKLFSYFFNLSACKLASNDEIEIIETWARLKAIILMLLL